MKPPVKPAPPPITPEQLRVARAALGWSLERLAARSDTTAYSIAKYEKFGQVVSKPGQPPASDVLATIRTALETAGVEFIDENGGGPGVRLLKTR